MPMTFTDAEIEAGSGKGAGDENFPVGSLLIAPKLRPHVSAYYDFARAADDIADHPGLSGEEKVRRLDAFGAVLSGEAEGLSKPEALKRSFAQTGIRAERGTDLLAAFRQDARKARYETLDDLLEYCSLSAEPVGRFLLDLHGEKEGLYPASDGLCTALQILNHLQDCADDFRALGRSYLPTAWLAEEGLAPEAVLAPASAPGLRRVMDRLLDACDPLIVKAGDLSQLRSRRLAAESAVITRLAGRLCAKLRAGDPVAGRVALGKADFAAAGLGGALSALFRRPPARQGPAREAA